MLPCKKELRSYSLGLGVCFLLSALGSGLAQDTLWQEKMDRGHRLREQGCYEEAEKTYLAALAQAQELGPEDSRLAESLNALAVIYVKKGRYAEAEPLFRRALAIAEKALDPEDFRLADILNNFGELCRTQGPLHRGRIPAPAFAHHSAESGIQPARRCSESK